MENEFFNRPILLYHWRHHQGGTYPAQLMYQMLATALQREGVSS